MTRLKIRDYEPQDFLDIEVMEHDMEFRMGMPLADWAVFKKHAGPAYTLLDADGKILVCSGVHNMWSGVGEAWAVFSPDAGNHPHMWVLAKQVMTGWKQIYHRLQAALDVNYPQAIRFDERLGFKPEGLMRRYGPHGEDRIMYAWVREN